MIGKTLGHYQITSLLGKGGMGEVFHAKDQVLGRDVAIKVLPEEFARDADRIARFQREAKVLASLNHPNIAAIYGLEKSGERNFLVLELVEGETLADRLRSGPIPVEDSMKLALQIAEALEAAHEKGIIHRDLKPANIKVTPDGKAKVLDFGLAKAFAGEQAEMNLSASPTLSHLATQQGIILGTAAYMSPEQAKGKVVDKRADIWAFGCVLYEMLTGQTAFQGEDVTEILAAVVKSGANLDLLPANIHPKVRELISRCLQKEPKKRYSGASDMQYEIEQVLANPGGLFVLPVTAKKPRTRVQLGLPSIAAGVILAAVLSGLAVWNLKPAEPRRVVRFDYELPEGQQLNQTGALPLAVSADGSQFVYATKEGLYLRPIDQSTAKLIPGTGDNASWPLFSPDGKWICYWSAADSQLKKIAVSGGAPFTLCAARTLRRPTWSADDKILYAQTEGIMQVSSNGGTPELIVKAEGRAIGAPQILPDGKTALFHVGPNQLFRKVVVQSLKSGERKELFAGTDPQYVPTGHIVYTLGNNLFAVPFSLDRLEVTGGPVSVVEGIAPLGLGSKYVLSQSGMLAYLPGNGGEAASGFPLVWVDRKGQEEALAAEPNFYRFPRISPDGKRLALTIGGSGRTHIWIWDLVRKTMTRLTFDGSNPSPLWTPDGKRIVYGSTRDSVGLDVQVLWKAADGTGKIEPLGSVPNLQLFPYSWSDNGKILVLQATISGVPGIGTLSMEGERKWKSLLQEKYSQRQPRVSPDGRWLAYTSNESGKNEVYVRPFPDVNSGGRWQVSTTGGDSPLWSPDGRELFYRNDDAVMAVPVSTGTSFSQETPKVLLRGPYLSFSSAYFSGLESGSMWDISPDGRRFLMLKPPNSAAPGGGLRKVSVVLNWFEELKQRVPTGNK